MPRFKTATLKPLSALILCAALLLAPWSTVHLASGGAERADIHPEVSAALANQEFVPIIVFLNGDPDPLSGSAAAGPYRERS
ncbi:MAG TPA: hypothetical protein DCQ14_06900, partial [Firmicutes bacterium]|nr:hypothetical protein [Bacillota bacterium]